FTFLFSDPAGYATISEAMFDIYSTSGTGPQCLGYYNPAANAVYLMNDAQNAWLGPLALNSTGSVQNSQCTLNSAGSSVTGSGNNLSWVVPLTFEAAFDGAKAISLYAASGSLTSSWVQAATWTVGTVASGQPDVVTASHGGGAQSATIIVSPPAPLTSLFCTPASLTSGEASTCMVTLSSPAGSGGLTLALSSNTAALTVPGSVTVAAGARIASFTASAGAVASAQTAVVTASSNGASESASISLQPASSQSSASIGCSPDPNNVGAVDCEVSLAQAAPVSGVTVALQANTSRVHVPAQVLIPAGALSVPFTANVVSSDQDTQAQITASVQGVLATAIIPITGIRPTSLSCVPQTVQAGSSFTCTVGMNNPNVLQVARLAVTSSSASFELPSPFVTRPGQSQVTFEVFTAPLAGQQSSTVTVQFGETAVTSSVAVTPATAPILNLPGAQLTAFGKPMSFAVSAVDPDGLSLTLSAANLPAGASFNPATGAFLWTPQAPSSLSYRLGASSPLERREVTFTATDSARISSTGSVVLEADPGLPVITDLRNAGSQQSQAVLPDVRVPTQPSSMSCSPGSVASLLGRWLAAGTQPVSNPTGSSTQLAGAEVIVNGNPAPVVYASATRIDFLCPEAVSGGALEISAQIDGAVSNVVHANQQATLGLFSADGSGQGQGMVTLSGTSLLATPRSYLNAGQPAEPGDTISIVATGAGLDAGPAVVQISIGGISTMADQVQPMPGMAGVYKVDVTVPASVAPGDAVPIVMHVADSSGNAIASNTVTIAVEAAR
ncbi:MAG: putative Ig domain-containing protein, partial [Bryobacteraceae bacterium]